MEFRILGPLEVVEEGHSLVLAAGKQRALLAILLLHANEVVSRDRLIDELWGEQAPVSAAKSIQIYVSQLRKALDDGSARARLLTRPNGYELFVEHHELDLNRFQDLVEEGRRAPPREAAAKFRAALALWRGPPLADFSYQGFAQAEIVRLEELRLSVVEERVGADLALGRQADLVGELEALVSAHPLRERLRGLLMLALYRSGRQAEALQVYQQTREVLVEELGLEPSRELQELEQAILRQDSSLELSPTTVTRSGTVTMVFTDIEGSTMLVRQLGDRYEGVLNTHCRLLRDAFGAAGGTEVDGQGDAFFFVVPSATDAVLAAAAAQRAFAQETWPAGTDVRVRIGVHTGEPGLGEEGYHGLGVVRAARISAAGHGGQVLVSQATRALIEDEDLKDLDVRDLGEHQLKDMPQPERLFQLVGPGLADDFPPLRAPAGARPLPVEGAEEELAEAARDAAAASDITHTPTAIDRITRHPVTLLAGGVIVIAAAIASAFIVTRGSGSGGLDRVAPNSVGAIDLKSNKIVAQVPVGIRPGPIVEGHGQLWVANLDSEILSRVDPRTQQQTDQIPLGAQPNGLGVQTDAIWAATGGGIRSIDPGFDSVRSVKVEAVKPPRELFTVPPTAVAFTRDAAWVVIGGHVTKADPKTGRVLEKIVTGTAPGAIASGGGNVWVADDFDNTVTRIDQDGAITATTSVGRRPSALAVGSDAVWVADADDDHVTRIDSHTAAVVTTIPVGRHPIAIALSPGAVWVANQYDNSIWRIDPDTNKVVEKIDVGGSPAGLAVASEALWFSVQAAALIGNPTLAKVGGAAYVDGIGAGATDSAEENTFSVQDEQREYATCAKLLNYPDKPAPAGTATTARDCPGDARSLVGRPDLYVHHPEGLPVLAALECTGYRAVYEIHDRTQPRVRTSRSSRISTSATLSGRRRTGAGKARHIAGVVARGNRLTIKLTQPAGDFLTRISTTVLLRGSDGHAPSPHREADSVFGPVLHRLA